MRKTSSAPATGQLALLDLPPAPAAPGRSGARHRVDGSRRALQAATNARQCGELLAALDRVSTPRVGRGAVIERGPFGPAATSTEEEMARRLVELYAACERAADSAVPPVPRRASR
jgi:hypothetical protein